MFVYLSNLYYNVVLFFCKTYTIITYQIDLFRVKFYMNLNFYSCDNRIVNFDFDKV